MERSIHCKKSHCFVYSEQARQKKLRNKEEYKRRKAKDRLRKLTTLLEKHKNLLKKDLKARQEVADNKLRKEIRVSTCLIVQIPAAIDWRKSGLLVSIQFLD